MKKLFILLVAFLFYGVTSNSQTVGSKVSFIATDSKTYTGTITEVQGDKYKVKYDGFDFDSLLTSAQFTVTDSPQNTAPATTQPFLPAPNANEQTTIPNTIGTSQNTDQSIAPANTVSIPANDQQNTKTSTDSLKMALADMKTSWNKLFGVKRDTMLIMIPDIDYDNSQLAQLNESLKKVKGVKSLVMHYKSGTATIEIAYKGKPSDVWNNLPGEVKSSFKVLEFTDNNITVKYK